MRGIHRGPVNSPHKWPVTRKMFPFDDVIMQMSLKFLPYGLLQLASIQRCISEWLGTEQNSDDRVTHVGQLGWLSKLLLSALCVFIQWYKISKLMLLVTTSAYLIKCLTWQQNQTFRILAHYYANFVDADLYWFFTIIFTDMFMRSKVTRSSPKIELWKKQ